MISVRVLPYVLQNTKKGLRFRSPFFMSGSVFRQLSLDDQAVVGRLDIHVRSQFAQLGCEIHVDREIM